MNSATVFAPATVANVAVGFDLLGFAIEGVGDVVKVSKTEAPGVVIREIINDTGSSDKLDLPLDPRKNSASVGLISLCADLKLDFGFAVTLRKGIALGSGMGGSAASAVGAIVAANELLSRPLTRSHLLPYVLSGEQATSGTAHADNAAPCLFGGLMLVIESNPARVVSIPVPEKILAVVVHPHHRVETRSARRILSANVSLRDHVQQSGYLGGLLAGCYANDLELIRNSFHDLIIEPQRAGLIPAFAKVKDAALKHGAVGVAISGSGPSMFAWVASPETAVAVRDAMLLAYQTNGVDEVDSWISRINMQGAVLVA
jgi:homoserine kinase